jgi:hypothetical protein
MHKGATLAGVKPCRMELPYLTLGGPAIPPDAHVASSSNMYGHVEDEEVSIYFHYLCFILIIYQF